MGSATHLYLVRHGATIANEARPHVLQGRGVNHSLSQNGRAQAKAVGEVFASRSFDALYASPLKRAVETAEAIGGHHGMQPELVETIHEIDVGRWEGMDWGTIQSEEPDEYRAFMNDPVEDGYPEGESCRDVLERVKPVFESLLDRHAGETLIVVAHNVVNRVWLTDLLGLPLTASKGIRQENTCVNHVKRKDGETYVVTLNAALHVPHRID